MKTLAIKKTRLPLATTTDVEMTTYLVVSPGRGCLHLDSVGSLPWFGTMTQHCMFATPLLARKAKAKSRKQVMSTLQRFHTTLKQRRQRGLYIGSVKEQIQYAERLLRLCNSAVIVELETTVYED